MKYLARKAIEKAINTLKLSLQPRSKNVTIEADQKQITHLLHSVKNDMDKATQELNGSTSTEATAYHKMTEEISDKLLNDYFTNGDIESIRALASGLIAQLSPTQAEEHLKSFKQHYNEFVKGE